MLCLGSGGRAFDVRPEVRADANYPTGKHDGKNREESIRSLHQPAIAIHTLTSCCELLDHSSKVDGLRLPVAPRLRCSRSEMILVAAALSLVRLSNTPGGNDCCQSARTGEITAAFAYLSDRWTAGTSYR